MLLVWLLCGTCNIRPDRFSKTRQVCEILSPFENGKPGKNTQDADNNKGIWQPDHIRDDRASQGTGEDGNIEYDGIPCKMGRPVILRDVFKHIVDICAIDHCKKRWRI